MIRKMCGLAVIGAAMLTTLAGEIVIPFHGENRIVIPARAVDAEKTAATELADYLHRVTGAEFSIQVESAIAVEGPAIYVGWTDFAARHGVDYKTLDQQNWVIKTALDGSIILSGGRIKGVLYAVSEFLERFAGVRWFDEYNEQVPQRSQLIIPETDEIGAPFFRVRQIYDNLDWQTASQRFKRHNKLQTYSNYGQLPNPESVADGANNLIGRPEQHHTFYCYSSRFEPSSPSMYSLDEKGQRQIAINSAGPGQICFTDPGARKEMLELLRGFIAEDRRAAAAGGYPPPVIYDISANDNDKFCVCPECRQLAEREGSTAGPLLDFINDIARNIAVEYPEVEIRTFAYMSASRMPATMRPEKNVIIHIALLGYEFGRYGYRDTMAPLSAPQNQDAAALLVTWSQAAHQIAIWDYWVLFEGDFLTPFINLEAMVDDMRRYKRSGVKDMFVECEYAHASSFFGLKRYLGAKLMQDPDRDPEVIINEFMQGMYGAGAGFMREYLDYLKKRQSEQEGALARTVPAQRHFLDAAFFNRAFTLLAQAAAATRNDPRAAGNVRLERAPLEYALLLRREEIERSGGKLPGSPESQVNDFKADAEWAVNYYYPEDNRGFREQYLAQIGKLYEKYSAMVLPAGTAVPFADRNAVLFRYFDFRDIAPVKAVDDAGAFGGKALRHGGNQLGVYPRTQDGATPFGIYDTRSGNMLCQSAIRTTDIPTDEKYHIVPLGRVSLSGPAAYFYGCAGWEMQCPLEKLHHGTDGSQQNSYDVYVSVKFTGPEYVPGSGAENAVAVDWVAFVPVPPSQGNK